MKCKCATNVIIKTSEYQKFCSLAFKLISFIEFVFIYCRLSIKIFCNIILRTASLLPSHSKPSAGLGVTTSRLVVTL